MTRPRAVSEGPATDILKRAGERLQDEPSGVKRVRLSDYKAFGRPFLQQNRNFSLESEIGGVPCAVHETPTRIRAESADADGSISPIERPSSNDTKSESPNSIVDRPASVLMASNPPSTIASPDRQNSIEDSNAGTKYFQDAEANCEQDIPPGPTSTRCFSPEDDVDVESVEDSQDMWTSVTSSDDSENHGVGIGYSERRNNTFLQTRPSVSPSKQVISSSIEKRFEFFKERIEDALSSFKREILSEISFEQRSGMEVMKDMLAEKDGIIGLLKTEIEQLRHELERCRDLVHQHGKETEEWADRMMKLIYRLPGFEGAEKA